MSSNRNPYFPTALIDFTQPENKAAMDAAVQKIRTTFNTEYSNYLGGKPVSGSDKLKSINPANKDEVIGLFQKGTRQQAEEAVNIAFDAFKSWSKTSAEYRANILFKAADLMLERRHEFSAMMVLESGKNFAEADADTAEAIDFMNFYGEEMLRYGQPQKVVQLPGEIDEMVYIPLGVTVVIPPWNFPNAILTGMTVAALVAGNTVVLKPASDTPAIAHMVYQLLVEAGIPDGVLNFLTGSGGVIGDTLVAHPKTRMIAFTGSMAVGTHINELAAKVHPGQIWLKRVIVEMGGKDAIVVNHDADLDDAADGIVKSAFGFQGQKCSACSRAIVHKDVYDVVLNKVIEKTNQLVVGPPENNPNMGPVINESAMNSIIKYIETGKTEGRLVAGGDRPEGNGYFINPTIIADVDPKSTIAQEEIFGPVLAFIKAESYSHALEIANDTIYGLTGAVYTKDKSAIETARHEFHVGNLYFNRKCTGAIVGAHPFGGFNMSGTDSKAGGSDYLLLFLQAKSMATAIKNY